MVKPSKCFSLQPNTETTKLLGVLALFIDKELLSRETSNFKTCDPRPIQDTGTINIGKMTSLPIWVSEIMGNPKNNNLFSSTTLEIQPHSQEQLLVDTHHNSDRGQEFQVLNSNLKTNSNGSICGESPLKQPNMVDASSTDKESQSALPPLPLMAQTHNEIRVQNSPQKFIELQPQSSTTQFKFQM
ncbi:hypothetical protein Tco_1024608 [Tanacetum coccineum]